MENVNGNMKVSYANEANFSLSLPFVGRFGFVLEIKATMRANDAIESDLPGVINAI